MEKRVQKQNQELEKGSKLDNLIELKNQSVGS